MTHCVVFDLETAPDLATARRLLGLGFDVADDVVREAIGRRYVRDGQAPADVFLKPPLHRIVCIGAVFAEREDDGAYNVRHLAARHVGEKSEAELVRDFVAALPRDDAGRGPVLVSFNAEVLTSRCCATVRWRTAFPYRRCLAPPTATTGIGLAATISTFAICCPDSASRRDRALAKWLLSWEYRPSSVAWTDHK